MPDGSVITRAEEKQEARADHSYQLYEKDAAAFRDAIAVLRIKMLMVLSHGMRGTMAYTSSDLQSFVDDLEELGDINLCDWPAGHVLEGMAA